VKKLQRIGAFDVQHEKRDACVREKQHWKDAGKMRSNKDEYYCNLRLRTTFLIPDYNNMSFF